MNYIRICLGFGFGQSKIYLYRLKYTPVSETTYEKVFDDPIEVELSDIDEIASIVNNPYGITM